MLIDYLYNLFNHSKFLIAVALTCNDACIYNGANFHPSALKNLLLNSTHCNLKACKKHYIVSIPIITPKVMLKNRYIPMQITITFAPCIPPPIVFYKNTLDSCPWAKESAQRRRYDAVLEILPNTNYIV